MEKLGAVHYWTYDRTPEAYAELKERIHGVDVLFCGWGVPSLQEDFSSSSSLAVLTSSAPSFIKRSRCASTIW